MNEIVILIDTREKNPLDFSMHGIEQEMCVLKTGDYTVKGMEDKIVIERKASTAELQSCIGKHRKRFNKELARMKDIPYKYIVCEFPFEYIERFPINSGIPKYLWKKIRVGKDQLLKGIEKMENEYNVVFCFCDGREAAQDKILEIIYDFQKANSSV